MPLAQKIDGIVRLFDGDLSLSEVLSMDIPSQRAMVQARLEQLRKSQEAYNEGKIDAYSRRYASTMGITGAGGGNSLPSPDYSDADTSPQQNQQEKQSLNARAR